MDRTLHQHRSKIVTWTNRTPTDPKTVEVNDPVTKTPLQHVTLATTRLFITRSKEVIKQDIEVILEGKANAYVELENIPYISNHKEDK